MTKTDIIEQIKRKAKASPKRIVFPEGENEHVISAAEAVTQQGIAKPILLGTAENIRSLASRMGVDLENVTICNPIDSPDFKRYVSLYSSGRANITEAVAKRLVKKNLFFAAMMVSAADADGMVAGIDSATATVLQVAGLAIGYTQGISAPSSIFIMVLPQIEGRVESVLVFADAAVSINPTARQLAEIAVLSGQNARRLLQIKPKVALLSFSTKGSASHPDVAKVVEATKIARQMAPDMTIDGELQADAALVPRVGTKKAALSPVAGQANVLVFPDLDAGNIAYKLTQYLGGARAYGPFLQGFARPVSDLSRGATTQDIIGATAVTAVQANTETSNGSISC